MDSNRLRQVPLFQGLSDEDVEGCAALFEEEEVLAGAGLAREGDFSYKFFVILEGEVDVMRDFEAVARVGPGDFVGEMGLVSGERRNARMVAHTRCVVAWMMPWNFEKMMDQNSEIAARIEAVVEQRMSSLSSDSS